MFIDVLVCIFLTLAVFKGIKNGLVVGLFSFLAFVIGLAAAMKLSAVAAEYIGNNISVSERWLPVVAFIAVFFIVVLLVRLGAKALEGVLRVAMLGWLNRLGGIVLYALIYLFILSIILFYASQINLIKQETVNASVTYPFIQPIGPKIIQGISYILPFFKDMFADLEDFFDQLSRKAS